MIRAGGPNDQGIQNFLQEALGGLYGSRFHVSPVLTNWGVAEGSGRLPSIPINIFDIERNENAVIELSAGGVSTVHGKETVDWIVGPGIETESGFAHFRKDKRKNTSVTGLTAHQAFRNRIYGAAEDYDPLNPNRTFQERIYGSFQNPKVVVSESGERIPIGPTSSYIGPNVSESQANTRSLHSIGILADRDVFSNEYQTAIDAAMKSKSLFPDAGKTATNLVMYNADKNSLIGPAGLQLEQIGPDKYYSELPVDKLQKRQSLAYRDLAGAMQNDQRMIPGMVTEDLSVPWATSNVIMPGEQTPRTGLHVGLAVPEKPLLLFPGAGMFDTRRMKETGGMPDAFTAEFSLNSAQALDLSPEFLNENIDKLKFHDVVGKKGSTRYNAGDVIPLVSLGGKVIQSHTVQNRPLTIDQPLELSLALGSREADPELWDKLQNKKNLTLHERGVTSGVGNVSALFMHGAQITNPGFKGILKVGAMSQNFGSDDPYQKLGATPIDVAGDPKATEMTAYSYLRGMTAERQERFIPEFLAAQGLDEAQQQQVYSGGVLKLDDMRTAYRGIANNSLSADMWQYMWSQAKGDEGEEFLQNYGIGIKHDVSLGHFSKAEKGLIAQSEQRAAQVMASQDPNMSIDQAQAAIESRRVWTERKRRSEGSKSTFELTQRGEFLVGPALLEATHAWAGGVKAGLDIKGALHQSGLMKFASALGLGLTLDPENDLTRPVSDRAWASLAGTYSAYASNQPRRATQQLTMDQANFINRTIRAGKLAGESSVEVLDKLSTFWKGETSGRKEDFVSMGLGDNYAMPDPRAIEGIDQRRMTNDGETSVTRQPDRFLNWLGKATAGFLAGDSPESRSQYLSEPVANYWAGYPQFNSKSDVVKMLSADRPESALSGRYFYNPNLGANETYMSDERLLRTFRESVGIKGSRKMMFEHRRFKNFKEQIESGNKRLMGMIYRDPMLEGGSPETPAGLPVSIVTRKMMETRHPDLYNEENRREWDEFDIGVGSGLSLVAQGDKDLDPFRLLTNVRKGKAGQWQFIDDPDLERNVDRYSDETELGGLVNRLNEQRFSGATTEEKNAWFHGDPRAEAIVENAVGTWKDGKWVEKLSSRTQGGGITGKNLVAQLRNQESLEAARSSAFNTYIRGMRNMLELNKGEKSSQQVAALGDLNMMQYQYALDLKRPQTEVEMMDTIGFFTSVDNDPERVRFGWKQQGEGNWGKATNPEFLRNDIIDALTSSEMLTDEWIATNLHNPEVDDSRENILKVLQGVRSDAEKEHSPDYTREQLGHMQSNALKKAGKAGIIDNYGLFQRQITYTAAQKLERDSKGIAGSAKWGNKSIQDWIMEGKSFNTLQKIDRKTGLVDPVQQAMLSQKLGDNSVKGLGAAQMLRRMGFENLLQGTDLQVSTAQDAPSAGKVRVSQMAKVMAGKDPDELSKQVALNKTLDKLGMSTSTRSTEMGTWWEEYWRATPEAKGMVIGEPEVGLTAYAGGYEIVGRRDNLVTDPETGLPATLDQKSYVRKEESTEWQASLYSKMEEMAGNKMSSRVAAAQPSVSDRSRLENAYDSYNALMKAATQHPNDPKKVDEILESANQIKRRYFEGAESDPKQRVKWYDRKEISNDELIAASQKTHAAVSAGELASGMIVGGAGIVATPLINQVDGDITEKSVRQAINPKIGYKKQLENFEAIYTAGSAAGVAYQSRVGTSTSQPASRALQEKALPTVEDVMRRAAIQDAQNKRSVRLDPGVGASVGGSGRDGGSRSSKVALGGLEGDDFSELVLQASVNFEGRRISDEEAMSYVNAAGMASVSMRGNEYLVLEQLEKAGLGLGETDYVGLNTAQKIEMIKERTVESQDDRKIGALGRILTGGEGRALQQNAQFIKQVVTSSGIGKAASGSDVLAAKLGNLPQQDEFMPYTKLKEGGGYSRKQLEEKITDTDTYAEMQAKVSKSLEKYDEALQKAEKVMGKSSETEAKLATQKEAQLVRLAKAEKESYVANQMFSYTGSKRDEDAAIAKKEALVKAESGARSADAALGIEQGRSPFSRGMENVVKSAFGGWNLMYMSRLANMAGGTITRGEAEWSKYASQGRAVESAVFGTPENMYVDPSQWSDMNKRLASSGALTAFQEDTATSGIGGSFGSMLASGVMTGAAGYAMATQGLFGLTAAAGPALGVFGVGAAVGANVYGHASRPGEAMNKSAAYFAKGQDINAAWSQVGMAFANQGKLEAGLAPGVSIDGENAFGVASDRLLKNDGANLPMWMKKMAAASISTEIKEKAALSVVSGDLDTFEQLYGGATGAQMGDLASVGGNLDEYLGLGDNAQLAFAYQSLAMHGGTTVDTQSYVRAFGLAGEQGIQGLQQLGKMQGLGTLDTSDVLSSFTDLFGEEGTTSAQAQKYMTAVMAPMPKDMMTAWGYSGSDQLDDYAKELSAYTSAPESDRFERAAQAYSGASRYGGTRYNLEDLKVTGMELARGDETYLTGNWSDTQKFSADREVAMSLRSEELQSRAIGLGASQSTLKAFGDLYGPGQMSNAAQLVGMMDQRAAFGLSNNWGPGDFNPNTVAIAGAQVGVAQQLVGQGVDYRLASRAATQTQSVYQAKYIGGSAQFNAGAMAVAQYEGYNPMQQLGVGSQIGASFENLQTMEVSTSPLSGITGLYQKFQHGVTSDADWESLVPYLEANEVDLTGEAATTLRTEGITGMSRAQSDFSRRQSGIAAASAQLSFAFTTGVGLDAYKTVDPRSGKRFNIPKGGAWGLQERGMELGWEQQDWSLSMQSQQQSMQQSQFMQNTGMQRQQQMMQRGWAVEDWGYQDQTRGLQWSWKQEDFQESNRFLTGRQRKISEREMGRATIMHNLEGEQIDKQRERQEETWDMEDKKHQMTISHFEEQQALQEENLKKMKEFYAENKQLQIESFELQKAQFIEQNALQRASAATMQEYADAMTAIEEAMRDRAAGQALGSYGEDAMPGDPGFDGDRIGVDALSSVGGSVVEALVGSELTVGLNEGTTEQQKVWNTAIIEGLGTIANNTAQPQQLNLSVQLPSGDFAEFTLNLIKGELAGISGGSGSNIQVSVPTTRTDSRPPRGERP